MEWFGACVELRAAAIFGSARRLNLALFLSVDRVATCVRGRRRFGESGGAMQRLWSFVRPFLNSAWYSIKCASTLVMLQV